CPPAPLRGALAAAARPAAPRTASQAARRAASGRGSGAPGVPGASGICGPRLEQPDGPFAHAARRGFPTPVSALGHFTGVGRRTDLGALSAYRAPDVESGSVDAVNGACMLIRREALDDVGLFDEGYWMYMEDLD